MWGGDGWRGEVLQRGKVPRGEVWERAERRGFGSARWAMTLTYRPRSGAHDGNERTDRSRNRQWPESQLITGGAVEDAHPARRGQPAGAHTPSAPPTRRARTTSAARPSSRLPPPPLWGIP